MQAEEALSLKRELLNQCLNIQQKNVDTASEAMASAQESANEQKGTLGDKWESFREQLQIDRDMYARQFAEGSKVLEALQRIDPAQSPPIVAAGALVITDKQRFFISASLGQLKVDGVTYIAVSTGAPLYLAMAGKKPGERFRFRDQEQQILEIW